MRLLQCSFLLGLVCMAGCSGPAADPSYLAEIESWRKERAGRLTAEDGWLTLVGLHWLSEGDNRFGSDPSNEVVLAGEGVPSLAGIFAVQGTTVHLIPAEGVPLSVNGVPAGERTLRDDSASDPDLLRLGPLSFLLISRGDKIGVRVKDPGSPTRTAFRGLEYFPIDPRYRVEARLERYAEPKKMQVQTVLGTVEEQVAPGRLAFTLLGRSLTLEPFLEGDDGKTLFVIFRDETAGKETYGAGRYLYATLSEDRATLDFNKAYNPPCAFTHYATCPVPPPENRLAIPIRAGEKAYAEAPPHG
jgi:uncharacterized protein